MTANDQVSARVKELKRAAAQHSIITEAAVLAETKKIAFAKPTNKLTVRTKLKALDQVARYVGLKDRDGRDKQVNIQINLTEDQMKW